MQTYYGARAPEYDEVYLKPERQADLRAIEHWVAQCFKGARVLEVACGTGYWTHFIAQTAARVYAFDEAAETLKIARDRMASRKVEFTIGDAYDPPIGSGGFDAAFAGFWFSHIPTARQRDFLSALNAVLETGANVVLLDNRFIEGSSTPIAECDSAGDTYQIRHLRDGSSHRILKNFPSETDLRSLAAGAGSDVRYRQWEYYWALEYVVTRNRPSL